MNGLDQYLALALNRSIGHSPLLDWLIGTVLDLPSVVSLFWDFRFAANNLGTMLHN